MAQLFEAFMVISFGISWPTSIYKSYQSKTAKGKSILFLYFVLFGYVCGIASKFMMGKLTYVLVFYILNFFMVLTDLLFYYKNKKLDEIRVSQSETL